MFASLHSLIFLKLPFMIPDATKESNFIGMFLLKFQKLLEVGEEIFTVGIDNRTYHQKIDAEKSKRNYNCPQGSQLLINHLCGMTANEFLIIVFCLPSC